MNDGQAREFISRQGHAEPPAVIRFHGLRGDQLVSAGLDGTIKAFDVRKEHRFRNFGSASLIKRKVAVAWWKNIWSINSSEFSKRKSTNWTGTSTGCRPVATCRPARLEKPVGTIWFVVTRTTTWRPPGPSTGARWAATSCGMNGSRKMPVWPRFRRQGA